MTKLSTDNITASDDPVRTVRLDVPRTPDIFADTAVQVVERDGVVRITLVSTRVDHMPDLTTPEHVVIGRLVMPIKGAFEMLQKVHTVLSERKLLRTPAAGVTQ